MERDLRPPREQAAPTVGKYATFVRAMVMGVSMLTALRCCGDEPNVPVSLQVELTCKVTKFDRNFAARAADKIVVLIAFKKGDVDSERIAKQLKTAFEVQLASSGARHEELVMPYAGAPALLGEAKSRKASIVILSPGVSSDGQAIAKSFDGYDGVTVSTSVEGVDKGLVLGFDLISGKPRMLLNLDQARRQNADFRAEVLKLMKVYP